MHGKLLSAIFPRYATDGLDFQSDNESEEEDPEEEEEEEVMMTQHPRMVTGPAVVPPPLRAQAAMLLNIMPASTTTVAIHLPGAVNHDEEDMTPQRTRMTAILLSQGLVSGGVWDGGQAADSAISRGLRGEYPQRPDDDAVFDAEGGTV